MFASKIDIEDFIAKRNLYNIVFYTPLHMLNNYAAAYEYCNAYAFLIQFEAIAELNYSFLSELLTRWSLILSNEAAPYWLDMIMLF